MTDDVDASPLRSLVLPVCGFPGVGKSHAARIRGWSDSDSSLFSWSSPGVRNPEWPSNYISHLRSAGGVVLVSTHEEVRAALFLHGLPFVLCYPQRCCKDEYIGRYRSRGSAEGFCLLVEKMWDDWLYGLESDRRACRHVVLGPGQYLGDIDWENRSTAANKGE